MWDGLAGQTVMLGGLAGQTVMWGGLAGQTLILNSVSKRRDCACPNLNNILQ